MITEVFSTEDLSQEDPNFMYEMFSSIDDFVSLPEEERLGRYLQTQEWTSTLLRIAKDLNGLG